MSTRTSGYCTVSICAMRDDDASVSQFTFETLTAPRRLAYKDEGYFVMDRRNVSFGGKEIVPLLLSKSLQTSPNLLIFQGTPYGVGSQSN